MTASADSLEEYGLQYTLGQEEIALTSNGYKIAVNRLEFLRTTKQEEITQFLQNAKVADGIIDSSAYKAAKEDQNILEKRISELEELLKRAKIIEEIKTDTVSIGSTVQVKEYDGKEKTFTIVSSFEADPRLGRISNSSPVGKALIGHKVGEKIVVNVPAGLRNFTILSIDKPKEDHQINNAKQNSTLTLRITEEPLTTQNLTTIITAINEIHTKYWLIQKKDFAGLTNYSQTHNPIFIKEANLIIIQINYNSPFELKLDAGIKEIAEALKTSIDAITQLPLRYKAMQQENEAKALEIQLKKQEAQSSTEEKELNRKVELQKAEIENQKEQLNIAQKALEIERQKVSLQKDILDFEHQRINLALKTANRVIDGLVPDADVTSKAMIAQTLLPQLLQLGNGNGLELVKLPIQQDLTK